MAKTVELLNFTLSLTSISIVIDPLSVRFLAPIYKYVLGVALKSIIHVVFIRSDSTNAPLSL